jgi:glycosyltransferase involved in cell wall biosynthesis
MRVLFVGFTQSIHTARWIRQLADQNWDLHLFPSTHEWQPLIHTAHRNVTIYGPLRMHRPLGFHRSVKLRGFWPWGRGLRFVPTLVRKGGRLTVPLATRWFPGLLELDEDRRLADLVRRLQPDVIHSMEIQHGGYLTLRAKELLGGSFPPWIVANWGSDIYFYQQLRAHRDNLKAVLAACDYYNCETARDVGLARDLGFRGTVFPVIPVAGGLDLDRCARLRRPGPTSKRRVILVKGYQNIFGRALTALRAIELCAGLLHNYRIVIYSAPADMHAWAEALAHSTGLSIEVLGHLSHDTMLRWQGAARASIGLSISDGMSTSFLEALAMGSFPIQSNTGGAPEWVRDGKTAFLVHPEDPESVALALKNAVTDDDMVDAAAEENLCTARERLSESVVRPVALSFYTRAAHAGSGKASPSEGPIVTEEVSDPQPAQLSAV